MDSYDEINEKLRKVYNCSMEGRADLEKELAREEARLLDLTRQLNTILATLDCLYEQEKTNPEYSNVVAKEQTRFNTVYHVQQARASALAYGKQVLQDLIERGY
jgi:hypothetical protein